VDSPAGGNGTIPGNAPASAGAARLRPAEREDLVDLAGRLLARSYSEGEVILALQERVDVSRGVPSPISLKTLRRLVDEAHERIRQAYDRSPEEEAAESLAALREIRRRVMSSPVHQDLNVAIRATEAISRLLALDRHSQLEAIAKQKTAFLERFQLALDSVGMDIETMEKLDRALRGMMIPEPFDASRGAIGKPKTLDVELIEDDEETDGESDTDIGGDD
jgi:hypothetical protein